MDQVDVVADTRLVPPDLTVFGKNLPWDDRLDLIRQTFSSGGLMGPSSPEGEATWKRAFDRDLDLMGRIMRDVLKADQAIPGRPGPRPALNGAKAQPLVDTWMGKDPTARPYSLLPFSEALTLLAAGHSVRQVARKVGLVSSHLHRLMKGELAPTGEVMEKVAAGFGKEPSYFVEYRIGTIAAAIVFKLTSSPERTIGTYESLYWSGNEGP